MVGGRGALVLHVCMYVCMYVCSTDVVPITLLSPESLCATSCFGFSRGGFLLFVCPSSVGIPFDFHVHATLPGKKVMTY
jgi:hypothetical protein